MPITKITLENFKGISDRTEVELKPITVLFGANSAGKSTLLQAMLYLRELLERRNADADQLQASGASIDLGGFQQFVHGHDLSRDVKIGVTVEVSDDGLPVIPVLELAQINGASADFIENGMTDIQTVGVEVSIRWDAENECPQIHSYAVSVNGGHFVTLEAESARQCYLVEFEPWHEQFPDEIRSEVDPEDVTIPAFKLDAYLQKENLLDPFEIDLTETENQVAYRVPIESISVIPDWNQLILPKKSVDQIRLNPQGLEEDIEELSEYAYAQAILSQVLVGGGRAVLEELRKIRYIGPLRKVPPRNFELLRTAREERWSDGLAAWDALHKSAAMRDGNGLVVATSKWLWEGLGLGYSLSGRKYYEVEQNGMVHLGMVQLAERALDEEVEEKMTRLLDLMEECPTRTTLELYDANTHTSVAPCDIGVGVSQVIPVVVGALRQGERTVVVEQPELHLHPAVQARLGDLFINGALEEAGNRFILESHSEHLMLRLLRRIRETAERDEGYPGYLAEVKPDDVSVYYVQSGEGKTEMLPLRVSEEGDFLDRWPNGFFDERTEELF